VLLAVVEIRTPFRTVEVAKLGLIVINDDGLPEMTPLLLAL
jgi:hypothetical protein